jgi:hypothetical protein
MFLPPPFFTLLSTDVLSQHPPSFAFFLVWQISDAMHKKHILWHDCHMLCMNAKFVAVFKKSYHECLSSLLEGKQGNALDAQRFVIMILAEFRQYIP